MMVDYHTHSRYCRHATGEVEEYVLAAMRLGFREIACSDHAPLPGDYDLQHRTTLEEYCNGYAPEISELAEKYRGRIRVLRAIECDHLPWTGEWTTKFIAENDFDFVIGSVHFVGKQGSERALFGVEYDAEDLPGLYEEYFKAIRDSAASGLYDVLGHVDLIKKLGPCNSKKIDELLWAALQEIRKTDRCIEINTSGWRRAENEAYPGDRVLEFAKDLGIPMTIGSDAHTPEDVGRDFDKALALIEKYGRGRIALFEKRQRREVNVRQLSQ